MVAEPNQPVKKESIFSRTPLFLVVMALVVGAIVISLQFDEFRPEVESFIRQDAEVKRVFGELQSLTSGKITLLAEQHKQSPVRFYEYKVEGALARGGLTVRLNPIHQEGALRFRAEDFYVNK